MGLLNAILGGSSSSAAEGYNKLAHGDSYLVCLNKLDKSVICYSSGLADTRQLIIKYLKSKDISEDEVEIDKYFYRKKDLFLKENEVKQICIVDSDVYIKDEIKDIIKTELKADKRNRFMRGLDKYTRR